MPEAPEGVEIAGTEGRTLPTRLMVGFDGSDGGRDALELAGLLARTAGAAALVVTVLPYGPLPTRYAVLGDEAAEETASLFEEARARLVDPEVETRAYGGGSPAAVMTGIAESEGIDMIVAGSPHRGAVGRVLIGSVADGLLHGAPCAVAVAPRGYAREQRELRRIAVAYDGTPESTLALRRAEALAAAGCASLRILTAVAPPPVTVTGALGYVPADPPEPDRMLTAAINSVDDRVAADGRRLDGPPAAVLAEACKDDVDLLVTGSRGYGPLARVLLGSVSTRLVHIAPCPVLVVPRP